VFDLLKACLAIFMSAMETTSRPVSPEQNLWDSILNSVSTRRSIPSGNVLILGEPSTGKTTLANALLQRLADGSRNETGEWFGKTDFALGYQWANVKEEGEEGLCQATDTPFNVTEHDHVQTSWHDFQFTRYHPPTHLIFP
jgi:Cdc6-like AAA superfamily ATPase